MKNTTSPNRPLTGGGGGFKALVFNSEDYDFIWVMGGGLDGMNLLVS